VASEVRMKTVVRSAPVVLVTLAAALVVERPAHACTSIIVSRGASKDGSVLVTYSADAPFMPRLLRVAGGTHPAGSTVEVKGWEDEHVRGKVPQAGRTFTVVGLMNEHQLSLGETTTGGRGELVDPKGLLDYDALMLLVLQRAKTAREAIALVDSLCREHGYGSSGETFSIADKDEAWLMELIGKGPGGKGIVWVAARVPEGSITAHANMSRITTFPLNDPDHWRYAPDVVKFAIEKGYYKTETGKPFSFRDAYHPDQSASHKRACAGRVWSVYRRSCPSENFSDAFFRGKPGAEDYPLFVKPDKQLSLEDVMGLMRDHYEGTPYDMTQGVDAGPFGSPLRARDLAFKVDGKSFMWERPISTQQAGFVVVNQSRRGLPDPVGGVTWFTPDEASTSCFTPLYCAADAVPAPYLKGDYGKFSWDSAWWVSNLVSNLAYDRWSRVYPDVRAAQREQEAALRAMQPVIEETAAKLAKTDEKLMRAFLTNYTVTTGEAVFRRWQDLAGQILTRHVDAYRKDDHGAPQSPGYSAEWLRRVVRERPEQFALPKAGETDH
jgi:dipeptidase